MSSRFRSASFSGLVFSVVSLSLSACATGPLSFADKTPAVTAEGRVTSPATPLDQYPLQAVNSRQSLNFRANPQGLSDNQRRALDQAATRAQSDGLESLDIVTSGEPTAMALLQQMANYLITRGVDPMLIRTVQQSDQPADILTLRLNMVQARTYGCNKNWENLSATGANTAYKNFGCAVTSNLAAQIADPHDLSHPRTMEPVDASRRSTVLDKYRQGKDTATEYKDQNSAKISTAIQ